MNECLPFYIKAYNIYYILYSVDKNDNLVLSKNNTLIKVE